MMKTACVAVICLLASTAMAGETVNFTAIPSQGGPGIVSYSATLTGGFAMGDLDWSGIATPIDPITFGSELALDISGPLGFATLSLGTGATFPPSTPFSGTSSAFLGGGDPAGSWTFDFYEFFDDGGDLLPDATWDTIDFTFNDATPFNLLEVYTDMASFAADLAADPAPLMEDFNIYTYGSFTDLTLPLSNAGFSAEIRTADGDTLFSGDGDMSTNAAASVLVVDVSGSPTPVTMIGGDFYGGDINAFPIPADVTITLQDGSTETYTTSTPEFRGFRADPSTPITEIRISSDDPLDPLIPVWPTMDNLKIGVYVPEPSSLALLALAGLCFIRRR